MGFPILVRCHLYIELGPRIRYLGELLVTDLDYTVAIETGAFTHKEWRCDKNTLEDDRICWYQQSMLPYKLRIQFLCFIGGRISQFTECVNHDDVIKWKHFPRFWPFAKGIHRSPVNSLTKASDAGDLRRHCTHYYVTVMKSRYPVRYLQVWVPSIIFALISVSIIKIRRSQDRLIYMMETDLLARRHLYMDRGSW